MTKIDAWLSANTSTAAQANAAANRAEEAKKRREKEKHLKMVASLKKEHETQKKNHEMVKGHLEKDKGKWFVAFPDRRSAIRRVMQYLILPRCIASPIDALYCSCFVETLYLIGTPSFHIVFLIVEVRSPRSPLLGGYHLF